MSNEPHPRTVDLPTPTGWPIIAAFGMALIFAGLVTSLFISAVGILVALFGAIGWFGDVFPHPRHEAVEVVAEEEGPAAITPRTGRVQHLKVGERGHRLRIPVEVHPYSAGVLGGLAGAVVMAILACAWGAFRYGSVWYPINLLAAAGVPELATASKEVLIQFSTAGLIVGSVAHITISVMVGLLYVVLLPMLPAKLEWFWGGIVTPLIWSALIFASLSYIDPRLAAGIDWPWFIVCQVAFGMVGGYVVFKSAKVETLQSLPLAAKMGVEADLRPSSGEEKP
ncbi:MAG: hypothetical protein Fur0032_07180 [Terrimicrobiaceae bacterium]